MRDAASPAPEASVRFQFEQNRMSLGSVAALVQVAAKYPTETARQRTLAKLYDDSGNASGERGLGTQALTYFAAALEIRKCILATPEVTHPTMRSHVTPLVTSWFGSSVPHPRKRRYGPPR